MQINEKILCAEVNLFQEKIIEYYEKYKSQMSVRQQKLYVRYLIDGYYDLPANITLDKLLRIMVTAFDQMECDCNEERGFKDFYECFTNLMKEWYNLHPHGRKDNEQNHCSWLLSCLDSPSEEDFRKRIIDITREFLATGFLSEKEYDASIPDITPKQILSTSRKFEKIFVCNDEILRIEHDCNLGRYLIWTLPKFEKKYVLAILSYLHLSDLAFSAYTSSLGYPYYVSQLPENLQPFILDTASFSLWARAMNTSLRTYIGTRYDLYDILWYLARLVRFTTPDISRENCSRLFSAMCPALFGGDSRQLYNAMRKGLGSITSPDEYDNLPEGHSMRIEITELKKCLQK